MKNKPFLLIISNTINKFGDALDLTVYMWLTYTITDSLILTGLVSAFNGLPSIILGFFSGIISDRFNKKKLIIAGDLIRSLIVLIIFILYMFSLLNVYILCISTIFISSAEILSAPARRSIIPFIVESDKIRKFNSNNSTGKTIASIIGISISGFLISKIGLGFTLIIDIICFLFSSLFILFLQFDCDNESNKSEAIIKDLGKGIRFIFNDRIIFHTTILATFVNIFIGGFCILIMGYCNDILNNSSEGYSVINACTTCGILILNIFLSSYKKDINLEKLINLGFIFLGITFILFGLVTNKFISYIIALLYGISTGCITISSVTILHKNTPPKHMGKVMSIISITNEGTIPIGNLITPNVINKIGITYTFISFGFFIILIVILLLLIFKVKRNN